MYAHGFEISCGLNRMYAQTSTTIVHKSDMRVVGSEQTGFKSAFVILYVSVVVTCGGL